MRKSLFTISVLILLTLPILSLSKQVCNKDDEKVLFKIKKSLGNPYHLASWDKTLDGCKWYNVDCDVNTSRLIALTIFQANISGQIPNAVGDLPFLEKLIPRKLTNLTGTIPSAITKLPRLTMLRLSWTNLTGPVPSFLNQLKNLNFLDLAFNHLTGSIPPELAYLTNLGAIHLDRNMLTGVILDSFCSFKGSIPDLYLSHNQLTGTIPKSLGYLNFSVIDLSRNQLTGDISMFFVPNKTIYSADFSRNSFKFNMSEVVFPESLTSLDVNHNKIFGNIPQSGLISFQFLNNFQQLYVYPNKPDLTRGIYVHVTYCVIARGLPTVVSEPKVHTWEVTSERFIRFGEKKEDQKGTVLIQKQR
ncbi:Leucine-rich repeat-containing protein [Artemisia annua]|uniref:Leucine-rich repeat-containing protein n=1 Tax=Artemisia annua TaxID=35608 RepID=A0A2U1NFJ3_ARTAN|nr:Leucine-rich repeat-containing protein [Artemisia annua]